MGRRSQRVGLVHHRVGERDGEVAHAWGFDEVAKVHKPDDTGVAVVCSADNDVVVVGVTVNHARGRATARDAPATRSREATR